MARVDISSGIYSAASDFSWCEFIIDNHNLWSNSEHLNEPQSSLCHMVHIQPFVSFNRLSPAGGGPSNWPSGS